MRSSCGGSSGHWGYVLMGIVVRQPLPFLFFLVLATRWLRPFYYIPGHDVLPCHSPKATGAINHGLETPKLWDNIKLFLYKLIISSICYCNRKLTNKSREILNITSQVPAAHACNLRYSGGRDRRIAVQCQPGQTVCEILPWKNPSQKGLVEWLKM
jgi:hypothetical protein